MLYKIAHSCCLIELLLCLFTIPIGKPIDDVHSVIILGAGVAGIASAECLAANGYDDVIILEARDRIGGRVQVQEVEGKTVNVGAQYMPEDLVAQMAQKYVSFVKSFTFNYELWMAGKISYWLGSLF